MHCFWLLLNYTRKIYKLSVSQLSIREHCKRRLFIIGDEAYCLVKYDEKRRELWMIILRNAIYLILSVCVGIMLLMLSGQKYFITNVQVKELFFHILFSKVLPFDLILMIILFFVVSYVPCYIFHKIEPIKLIQGV